MNTAIVSEPSGFALPERQLNVIRWNIYFGFAVLAIGVILGLGQALNYAHVNVVHYYPVVKSYYQGLTIHGVFNALVLTSAFGNGFIALTTARIAGPSRSYEARHRVPYSETLAWRADSE
jgi:cytochrome c oxidase subunit I